MSVPPPHPRPLARRAARPVLAVGGALVLGGCLRVLAPGESPPAPEPIPEQPVVIERVEEAPEPETGAEALLREAEARLGKGDVEEAVKAFETYLAFDVRENGTHRALWGLALAHLLPDTPVENPERASRLLERLQEQHPLTVEALQARWIRSMLDDLSRARLVAQERERTIRQLNETLEQLRQIDLNRRPGGGPRPADTLPRPRPNG